MPVTGLFFFPSPSSREVTSLPDLITRITTTYTASPLPRWTLDHRLFRENNISSTAPLPSDPDKPPTARTTRYLQILTLSHHPNLSHIAITTTHPLPQTRAGTPTSSTLGSEPSGEPASIIAIPAGQQSEEFVQLMISRFGPLWTQRQVLTVGNGQAWEIGDFRVRVGEVRQGGSAQQSRGVVVEVEWEGGEADDWESAEGVIRGFWDALGVKGSRECLVVAGMEDGFAGVRRWAEVLRLRG